VRDGQEVRAVGVIQKTPYKGSNFVEHQTFAVTIYRDSLEVAAKEAVIVTGSPTAPASVRATWTADYDGLAYIAISASDNHDSAKGYGNSVSVYDPKDPKPSAYTLRIRREGDAGEAESVPRLQVEAGNGFDQAGELTSPGLAATDLKVGEVVFYRLPANKGDEIHLALAAQKPWFTGSNFDTKARYVITVYDDDQVQIAQKAFDVSKNPPDAHSALLSVPVELSGSVYVSVSCENAGQSIYEPKEGPRPGRVALQITSGAAADADDQEDE
jgi:hypothetical protein